MDKKRDFLGAACGFMASALFGLSFLFTKEAVNTYSALTVLAWRFIFAFAALGFCALTGIIKINLRGKKIAPLLLIALFQPMLYFIGETIGVSLTTASESGTLTTCIPIITIIMCSLIIKEPPTKLQVVGICVSVVGVLAIVLAKGLEASLNILGYGMLIIAMISDGLFVTLARKAKEYTSAEKTFIQAAVGAIGFTLSAFVEHGFRGTVPELVRAPFADTSLLVAVLYLALGCQVLAFLMSNYSIQTIGAARCTSFAGITTVVSVLAGVIILNESFSLLQGFGTGLVLVGVYAANFIPKSAKPVPLEELNEAEKADA